MAGSAVPRAELAEWRERFGLVAGITERGGADAPFSLGLSAADPAGQVMVRFRAFRAALRPAFTALQMAHQVHGRNVLWHEGVAPGWHVHDDADGHATTQAGLLLAVSVADCVPVYLTRDDGSAFALLHAGWRGTAGGVLEAGVALLCAARGTLSACPPDRLSAHSGVAICGACYEVGEEVARAVLGPGAPAGKQHLDLRAVLAGHAEAGRVGDISVSPLCTSCNRDRFFSHRGSGGDGGRQIAYLGRPLKAES